MEKKSIIQIKSFHDIDRMGSIVVYEKNNIAKNIV